MFKVGDLVVYGGEGVCRVEAVGTLPLTDIKSDKLYYTLVPLYRSGRTFAPVDGKVLIRPILTRAEAEALIRSIPQVEEDERCPKGARVLSEHYQQLLQSYDCGDLVQLIKTIYVKQQEAQAAGRRFGQVDERYRKRAEEMLHGELAASLGIPKEAVAEYIRRVLEGDDSEEAEEERP